MDEDPALLTEFYHWMRKNRGISDVTLCIYGRPIRDLLKRFGNNSGMFDAIGLRQFVLEKGQHSEKLETLKSIVPPNCDLVILRQPMS